jgi:hypothetical protein
MFRLTVIAWALVFCTNQCSAGTEYTVVFSGKPSRGVLSSANNTVVDSSCTAENSTCIECIILRSQSGKLVWASRDSTELTFVRDGPLHIYVAKNGKGSVTLEAFAVEAGGRVAYTEVYSARPVVHTYFGDGVYEVPPASDLPDKRSAAPRSKDK